VLENNTKVSFDKLVLATGSPTNTVGQDKIYKVYTGLYHKQDLEALENGLHQQGEQ
jgi:NADH dehydrogenase FAD-containing subunit